MGRMNRIPFPPTAAGDLWELDWAGATNESQGELTPGASTPMGGFKAPSTIVMRERAGDLAWTYRNDLGTWILPAWRPGFAYFGGEWYASAKPQQGVTWAKLFRWNGSSWTYFWGYKYGLGALVILGGKLWFLVETNWLETNLKVYEITGTTTVTFRNNINWNNRSTFYGPDAWNSAIHNYKGYFAANGAGLAFTAVATNQPADRFNAVYDGKIWQGSGNQSVKYKTSNAGPWVSVACSGYYAYQVSSDGNRLYAAALRMSDWTTWVILSYNGSSWTEEFVMDAGGRLDYLHYIGGRAYATARVSSPGGLGLVYRRKP